MTFQSGLSQPAGATIKYGGASIADVDGDGRLDLLLTHHNGAIPELYFNNPSSKNDTFNFRRARTPWFKGDFHAVSSSQLSPFSLRHTIFFMSGGSNGNNPQPPRVYEVTKDRRVVDVASRFPNLNRDGRARLRALLPVRLQSRNKRPPYNTPDLLFTSVHMTIDPAHQRAFRYTESFPQVGRGSFQKLPLNGSYQTQRNEFVTVTDVDNDGVMELIGFQSIKVHKLTWKFDYKLIDISRKVLPPYMLTYDGMVGIAAIAEFDFDNDGWFDLYIARTTKQNLHWLRLNRNTDDILLRNVKGKYVDVSRQANIPLGGFSRGVTAADFDNDGLVDLVVSQFDKQDMLLRNLGNGKFADPVPVGRNRDVVGDMAHAVDLDEDGNVDLVVSEGAWIRAQAPETSGGKSAVGFYRLLKNFGTVGSSNNWLLVRVGNAPGNTVTSLHALVRVVYRDPVSGQRIRLSRRVGGSEAGVAVGVSWISTVHFGVGQAGFINQVIVKWADKTERRIRRITPNQKIQVGIFPSA